MTCLSLEDLVDPASSRSLDFVELPGPGPDMSEQIHERPTFISSSVRFVRFGLFEADLQERELRKQGRRIKLQTQPFQILEVLLARPGEIVSREELCKRLWPGDTFVDFDHSLNTAIRRLREVLADSPDNPIFIETLQRQGYRFIAPVVDGLPAPILRPRIPAMEVGIGSSTQVGSVELARERVAIEPETYRKPLGGFYFGLVGLVAGVLLTVTATYIAYRVKLQPSQAEAEQVRSLAVLPLENLSVEPDQEYLADGMTDELIASLAKVRSLRVVPRSTSMAYKGTHKPLSEIAHELNVDAVVEGTVMRSGSRIRITTELVQIASDRALWAETHESNLDDVLSLQQRVAGAIVSNIQVQLTPEERQNLKAYQPSAPEAYEHYLRGRYYWNKRSEEGLTRAIAYFEQATREDPNYALAYAGLADCYGIIGAAIVGTVPANEVAPKAEAAAKRALELDPSLAEAQNALATMMLNYKWDWPGAENGFRKTLELDPTYATAHQRYSLYLIAMGRTQESMSEIQEALKIDPLSVSMNFSEGWRLYMGRKYDEAIQQLRTTIDMDKSFALPHLVLGQAYAEKGQFAEAVAELEKAAQLSKNSAPAVAALARVYAISGRAPEARARLEQLKRQAESQYVSPFYLAQVHAALAEPEVAMDYLEKAFQDRSNSMIFLRVDPEFDTLRANPRFQKILERMQL